MSPESSVTITYVTVVCTAGKASVNCIVAAGGPAATTSTLAMPGTGVPSPGARSAVIV
jgi:hypothetical protein